MKKLNKIKIIERNYLKKLNAMLIVLIAIDLLLLLTYLKVNEIRALF